MRKIVLVHRGLGLSAHGRILADALTRCGHEVIISPTDQTLAGRAADQIIFDEAFTFSLVTDFKPNGLPTFNAGVSEAKLARQAQIRRGKK